MTNQKKLISIISIIGFLFIAVLFSVLYLSYKSQKKVLESNAINYTENISELTKDKLEGILRNIAQTPNDLQVVLENTSMKHTELTLCLRKILERNPSIYGLCAAYEKFAFDSLTEYYEPYFYRDGDSLAYVNYDILPEEYFEKDWYKTPKDLNKSTWIEPYADSTAGMRVMTTLSTPFRNKDGSVKGIIATDVFLQDFRNYLADFKILETGYVFTFSSENYILTHRDSTYIMRETMQSLSKKLNQPVLEEIADSIKTGKTGFIKVENIFNNQKSVVNYYTLSSGWGVAIIFPEKELYSELKDLQEKNIIIAVSGFILVFGVSIFVYFVFLRKIDENNKKTLEKLVVVRTVELNEKNQELIAIEEELRQNNEELLALNEDIQKQKEIILHKSEELKITASELSEKNQTLEDFNLQLKKYFTIIEQSPFAIVITDTKGRIEYVNPYFTKITGYEHKDSVGKNINFLKSGTTLKETFTNLWNTILEGKTWEGIIVNKKKDETLFTERAIITPIIDNEKIMNFVAIKEDVTELKKAEQLILDTLKTTREQKIIIENAHKNITDSINYAKTIQKSLLPNEETLKKYVADFFLMYKPKEVVSGDFYYVNKTGDDLIFAVADCTGHGVPGGFMTMIGISFLHEIILQNKIKTAGGIVDNLRQRIKETFQTFGTENKSGMDIVLCLINTKTNILQFAGAFNPLYLVRNSELIEIKGTKNPIGFYPKEVEFVNNVIQLQENDLLYLVSDGFQDQFGTRFVRKFTKSRLKELILTAHKQPLANQCELFENALNKWQGNIEQVDDITVLAFEWKIQ